MRNYKRYLCKCDDTWMACAYEAEKGCLGVEYGAQRKQIFQYVFKGSARVGKLFSGSPKIIDDSKGKLVDCKEFYNVDTAFEFLEDTEMWGFNVLDDNTNSVETANNSLAPPGSVVASVDTFTVAK